MTTIKTTQFTIRNSFSATPSRDFSENLFDTKEEAIDYLKFFESQRKKGGNSIIESTDDSFTIELDDESTITYSVQSAL